MSLGFLLDFASRVPDGYTTCDVVNRIIRPVTASKACAYVELLDVPFASQLLPGPPQRGEPTYVVVHHWGIDFKTQLVDLLQQYVQVQALPCPPSAGAAGAEGSTGADAHALQPEPPTPYLWLDVFATNLHAHEGEADATSSVHDAADQHSVATSMAVSSAVATVAPASRVMRGPLIAGLRALKAALAATYIPGALRSPAAPHLPGAVAESMLVVQSSPSSAPLPNPAPRSPDLLLVLDPRCAVLTSPCCLYAVWLRAFANRKQHRKEVLRAKGREGGAFPGRSAASSLAMPPGKVDPLELTATAAGKGIVPVCAAGHDLLVGHLVWEQLGLQRPSPCASASAQMDIVEDVAQAMAADEAEDSPALGVRRSANSFGGPRSAPSSSSLGSVALQVPARPPATPMEVAAALMQAAILGALQLRVDALAAATGPSDAAAVEPSSQSAADGPPVAAGAGASDAHRPGAALALADALDVAGSLMWAAGHAEEAEALLRRCRDIRTAALGAGHHLSAYATLHLGALLHAAPGRAEEAELLLRNAVVVLGAAPPKTGPGAEAGLVSMRLLAAAQGRHFLGLLLGLRRSPQAAAAVYDKGVARTPAGLHLARNSSIASNAGSLARKSQGSTPMQPLASQGQLSSGPASPRGRLSSMSSHIIASQVSTSAEVLELLQAALSPFEAAYGMEHPLTAMVLSNQALALKDVGSLEKAEPLLRRALDIREQALGAIHLDTMRSLNNLAGLLEAQDNLEEAEALLRRTAELAAGSLGPNSPSTATSLSNLGVVLRKLGKLEEAEELFTAALEIRERVLGSVHLDTAASLSDMTMLQVDQGRLLEAEPLFRRILDIRELVLGPAHPDTAASLCDLASLLSQLDRAMDAEPLLRRAVSIHVRALGPGHEDTAGSTRELAKLLAQQGKAQESEKHFRRALAIMEAVVGPAHPETAITCNQLALLLKDQGNTEEAAQLFRRVLKLSDEAQAEATAHGTDESNTGEPAKAVAAATAAKAASLRAASMVSMRNLADIAVMNEQLEEAETLACRCLVMSEEALGPTHAVTLSCAEGLADILRAQGMLEDAAELLQRLVESLAEEQGEESDTVQRYLALYEEVYTQLEGQNNASEGGKPGAMPASPPSTAGAAVPGTPTRELLHTSSTASLGSRASRAGRKRDLPENDGDDALGVHHSFASFVSRRSMGGKSDTSSATIGSTIVGNGMASRSHSVTSRAHSVQGRAHPLASRANSLSGPGMSRFRPPESTQVSDNGSNVARARVSSSGLPPLVMTRLRPSQAGAQSTAPLPPIALPALKAASGLSGRAAPAAVVSPVAPVLAATIKGHAHAPGDNRPATPVLAAANQGEGGNDRIAPLAGSYGSNGKAVDTVGAAARAEGGAAEPQQVMSGDALPGTTVQGNRSAVKPTVVAGGGSTCSLPLHAMAAMAAPEIEVSPASPRAHEGDAASASVANLPGRAAANGDVGDASRLDSHNNMDVAMGVCGCFGRPRRLKRV